MTFSPRYLLPDSDYRSAVQNPFKGALDRGRALAKS